MTKQDKLQQLYLGILGTLDITANEGGLLSSPHAPIVVNDKRVALPTKEVLKELHKGELIAFHPLSEDLFKGVSPVLTMLRKVIMAKVDDIITSAGYVLLAIASDESLQESLTAKQKERLADLAGADDKLVDNYKKLVNEVLDVGTSKRSVSIVLKRGYEIGDTKHARAAVVSFPLAREIDNSPDGMVYGVKFRKKDLPILRSLMDILLPLRHRPDGYTEGTNADVAPYFVALLKVYASLLAELGGITWVYRSAIEKVLGRSLHVKADDILAVLDGDGSSLVELVNAVRPLPENMGQDEALSVEKEDVEQSADSLINSLVNNEEVRVKVPVRTSTAPSTPAPQVQTPSWKPGMSVLSSVPRVGVTRTESVSQVPTRSSANELLNSLTNPTVVGRSYGAYSAGRGYDNSEEGRGYAPNSILATARRI